MNVANFCHSQEFYKQCARKVTHTPFHEKFNLQIPNIERFVKFLLHKRTGIHYVWFVVCIVGTLYVFVSGGRERGGG